MATYKRSIPIPGKTSAEIYDRISKAISKFQENDSGKFGKFDITTDAASKSVKLESSHVTADLQCMDGEVQLAGKLSFLASAFKSKIDSGINDWVAKAFQS
ncbi:MAG: polyhydroxyalkanoic acid system family protein [Cryobacterium sp.]|nr:polyhydroxyalkanoic acid system family protein [Oligoflexia bacterium]